MTYFLLYYSDKDYKRIDAVMKNHRCNNYTLHFLIDECISVFESKERLIWNA